MRIAIIGTGIAGNVAAYHLQAEHELTIYEQNSHVGGHTHTHDLEFAGNTLQVDTGFIVLNNRTYPNFMKLLDQLDVDIQPTEMSFSVKCERTGLEYNGSGLNKLFAQRSNIFRPQFHRMIRDILRFNREATDYLSTSAIEVSLGQYLARGQYSDQFINQYIVPMGAAIWSAEPSRMFDFPALFFMRFFANHGLLSVKNRPQWYVIKGGSRQYVDKLTAGFRNNIRMNTPVKAIRRYPDRVEIISEKHGTEIFDYVVMATHSDQALEVLDQPSSLERQVLSSIPYQENEAVLHTDEKLLPKNKLAWASWNYHIPTAAQERVALTYDMNILQGLNAKETYCVTLNYSDHIDEDKIIKKVNYHHPVFTPEGIEAQARHRDINGTLRTYYCGAYWRNGFHEDGVVSALTAIDHINQDMHNDEQLHLRRAS